MYCTVHIYIYLNSNPTDESKLMFTSHDLSVIAVGCYNVYNDKQI